MKTYTIGKLADLAGISVRTLHHYDHIGLLRPSQRSGSGYRHYQRWVCVLVCAAFILLQRP